MKNIPLRYNITDWRQLPNCLSNLSRDLKLVVTVFINDARLNGLRIQVVHKDFDVLFACVHKASGSLVSKTYIKELTTDEILNELQRYGFYITYSTATTLSGDQITYLMTLSKLKFGKIRIMNVWDSSSGVKEFTEHLIAFNANCSSDWLNSGYSPSISEFNGELNLGNAIDLSSVKNIAGFEWDFLYNCVTNVDDLIKANS